MSGIALRDIQIDVNQPFDYAALPAEVAGELREASVYVNQRIGLTYRLLVEIGQKLIEVRHKYEGVFMAWSASEFNVSYDTITNWMNIAANMPALTEEQSAMFQLKALYKLSLGSTPAEAQQRAIALAEDGHRVDYETAFILANAPEQIQVRYLNEELTKKEAYALARVYSSKAMPVEVRDYTLQKGVRDAEVVRLLWKTHEKAALTAGDDEPSRIWKDITEDGDGNLNGIGWSKPLSDADATDFERYKVDLQSRIIEEKQARWHWQRVTKAIKIVDGRAYVDVSEFTALRGASEVMLDVRLPAEVK